MSGRSERIIDNASFGAKLRRLIASPPEAVVS